MSRSKIANKNKLSIQEENWNTDVCETVLGHVDRLLCPLVGNRRRTTLGVVFVRDVADFVGFRLEKEARCALDLSHPLDDYSFFSVGYRRTKMMFTQIYTFILKYRGLKRFRKNMELKKSISVNWMTPVFPRWALIATLKEIGGRHAHFNAAQVLIEEVPERLYWLRRESAHHRGQDAAWRWQPASPPAWYYFSIVCATSFFSR